MKQLNILFNIENFYSIKNAVNTAKKFYYYKTLNNVLYGTGGICKLICPIKIFLKEKIVPEHFADKE